jgi:hypothetical protein
MIIREEFSQSWVFILVSFLQIQEQPTLNNKVLNESKLSRWIEVLIESVN